MCPGPFMQHGARFGSQKLSTDIGKQPPQDVGRGQPLSARSRPPDQLPGQVEPKSSTSTVKICSSSWAMWGVDRLDDLGDDQHVRQLKDRPQNRFGAPIIAAGFVSTPRSRRGASVVCPQVRPINVLQSIKISLSLSLSMCVYAFVFHRHQGGVRNGGFYQITRTFVVRDKSGSIHVQTPAGLVLNILLHRS